MFGASESSVRDQGASVTQGPWQARDGYIAETAVKLDRLRAKLERLEQQGEVASRQISELVDHASHSNRLQAVADNLRTAREYKLEAMQRLLRDLQSRVSGIEGPLSKQAHLTFRSFETVDEQLKKLSLLEGKIERTARLSVYMLACSALMLAATVAARLS